MCSLFGLGRVPQQDEVEEISSGLEQRKTLRAGNRLCRSSSYPHVLHARCVQRKYQK